MRAEQDVSSPDTCAHGVHDGVVSSLKMVESPSLGIMDVPRGHLLPGVSCTVQSGQALAVRELSEAAYHFCSSGHAP